MSIPIRRSLTVKQIGLATASKKQNAHRPEGREQIVIWGCTEHSTIARECGNKIVAPPFKYLEIDKNRALRGSLPRSALGEEFCN